MDDTRNPAAGGGAPPVRFEATVHPGVGARALGEVADLDLDRVPDPDGGVRVLVTADDAARLVEQGFEVHLVRALPVRPLDPSLVASDDDVTAWLDESLRGIEREEGG